VEEEELKKGNRREIFRRRTMRKSIFEINIKRNSSNTSLIQENNKKQDN